VILFRRSAAALALLAKELTRGRWRAELGPASQPKFSWEIVLSNAWEIFESLLQNSEFLYCDT
jgi:hypothetical protein